MGDGEALEIVFLDDLGELLEIGFGVVELWAADDDGFAG